MNMKKTILYKVLPLVLVLVVVFSVVIADPLDYWRDREDVFVTYDPEPEPLTRPYPRPITSPMDTSRWDDGTECGFVEEIFEDPRPRALLTGLPIDEEYLYRRPVAVVINNLHRALPQSGITSADIIYEVLAEGDVTRLVGIFQSCIPDKIGPVRSARDSFIDFAFNHDALFVHHGRSPDADARLRNTRIVNLDGMSLGQVFWRDRNYPYWHANSGQRPLEHSSYTGWSRIVPHLDSRNIRNYVNDNPAYGLSFGTVPHFPDAGIANTVVVPFSVPYTRTFVFDPETEKYLVENRDGPLVDAETREQVAVTNILIQITTKRVTGTLGQRTIGTVGTGDGFLAVSGYYRPVRWAKDSHTSPMRWYCMDGQLLTLAPGRTWICVFQNTGTVRFE